MVNKQGVHPFNICLFVVVFSYSHLFFFKVFSIFLSNIQEALFLKKAKTRTCFSLVSLVLFLLILLL